MSVDLIRTPAGWAYPDPGPCPCGVTAATVGFEFCRCAGAVGGGHPAWRCRACDEVRTLGCVGAVLVANEYGGKSGTPRPLSGAEGNERAADEGGEAAKKARNPIRP